MRARLAMLAVVAQIAVRNLFGSRWKTLIVGGIIAAGAFAVVVGTSLVDSIDHAMSRSIIGSIAGDVQVYSSESKNGLELMGGIAMNSEQTAPLDSYERVRETLLGVPNVAQVVPMGLDSAAAVSGNTVDRALARLRESVKLREAASLDAAVYQTNKDHVRQIIRVLSGDLQTAAQLHSNTAVLGDQLSLLREASSDPFWAAFDQEPLARLEQLENQIAPLLADADLLYLRYVGTDPAVFERSFERMKIVEGSSIPEGKRGFLFSKYVYEDQVKLKAARLLDKINEERTGRGALIAQSPSLQRMVKEGTRHVRELLLQLDSQRSALFSSKLQALLGSADTDLASLLQSFLSVDDSNFEQRYAFFYSELAPHLELYRVRIGDTLTVRGYGRNGYVRSVNLEVYGTFAFAGLERSPQAGIINVMDLVSFRELYGFMTADRQREVDALRASVGSAELRREDAEAQLFGSLAAPVSPAAVSPAAVPADVNAALAEFARAERREPRDAERYDPAQLQHGVILNAAVFLKDPSRMEETIADIVAAGKREGLPLAADSWQKAAGMLGQFAGLMRIVLYTAVLVIFLVALVILNNSLVMAALERVREVGTLRAIGAPRALILVMLLLEAAALGLAFGALGAALGAGFVAVLGSQGIPAFSDVLTFFFSGPRLYPALSGSNVGLALGVVLLVSIASSLYPAILAMRISPVRAMASEE